MKLAAWLWDRFIVLFWCLILSAALLGGFIGSFDRHPVRHLVLAAVVALIAGEWYSSRKKRRALQSKGDLARGTNDSADGGSA